MSNNEQVLKSIHNRGLNDYTANKVSHNEKSFTPPKRKSAICISSYYPGMKIDKNAKWQQD